MQKFEVYWKYDDMFLVEYELEPQNWVSLNDFQILLSTLATSWMELDSKGHSGWNFVASNDVNERNIFFSHIFLINFLGVSELL